MVRGRKQLHSGGGIARPKQKIAESCRSWGKSPRFVQSYLETPNQRRGVVVHVEAKYQDCVAIGFRWHNAWPRNESGSSLMPGKSWTTLIPGISYAMRQPLDIGSQLSPLCGSKFHARQFFSVGDLRVGLKEFSVAGRFGSGGRGSLRLSQLQNRHQRNCPKSQSGPN